MNWTLVILVIFGGVAADHDAANWHYLACAEDCIERGHFFCVNEGFENFNGHDEIEQGECCFDTECFSQRGLICTNKIMSGHLLKNFLCPQVNCGGTNSMTSNRYHEEIALTTPSPGHQTCNYVILQDY